MDMRYPIGRFTWNGPGTPDERRQFIDKIAVAPSRLREAIHGLSAEQLDTPYRDQGWTVRQVIHHVPDSHMNSFVRFKLALTEDHPTVKPYNEEMWSRLEDARSTPIEVSLTLLESLHQRWVVLLRSLSDSDFKREFKHPEIGPVSLDKNLALYAWHGAHHTAHITALRERMGWK